MQVAGVLLQGGGGDSLQTVLHYEFEDVDGSTNFVDLTGRHSPELRDSASAWISTNNPLFGSSSLYFSNKSSYLASDPLNTANDDFYFPNGTPFKIEFSFYLLTSAASHGIFNIQRNVNSVLGSLKTTTLGNGSLNISDTGLPANTHFLSINTLYTLVIERTSDKTLTVTLNNTVIHTVSNHAKNIGSAIEGAVMLGGAFGISKMKGYIDRVIVKKG